MANPVFPRNSFFDNEIITYELDLEVEHQAYILITLNNGKRLEPIPMTSKGLSKHKSVYVSRHLSIISSIWEYVVPLRISSIGISHHEVTWKQVERKNKKKIKKIKSEFDWLK